MPDALPAPKRATLFDGLRNGQDVAAAAQAAGLDARTVSTAARADTALALLLAGTDPDELGAAGLIQRAEYLRLPALGCTPSLAAQILLDGAAKASHWRQEDPVFAKACDAVKEFGAGRPAPARSPLLFSGARSRPTPLMQPREHGSWRPASAPLCRLPALAAFPFGRHQSRQAAMSRPGAPVGWCFRVSGVGPCLGVAYRECVGCGARGWRVGKP
ncbi:hypothetical protein AB0M92_36715 [Streptomyces sp. NPDC051582]|uniref:hypothetical protein n=1 Tax=Streptomyces sp. NPDC051582 TaxID=3155167 RepID=UPI0034385B1F